jgi:hypothetical protein
MFFDIFESLPCVKEWGEYQAIKPVPEVVPPSEKEGSLEYYGGKKRVKKGADFAKEMQDELDKNKHPDFSDKPQVLDS